MINKKVIFLVVASMIIGSTSVLIFALSQRKRNNDLQKIIRLQDSVALIQTKVNQKREIIYELHIELDSVETVVQDVLRSIRILDDSLKTLNESLYEFQKDIRDGLILVDTSSRLKSFESNLSKIEIDEKQLQKKVISALVEKTSQMVNNETKLKWENNKLKDQMVELGSDLWDKSGQLINLRQVRQSHDLRLQREIRQKENEIEKLQHQLSLTNEYHANVDSMYLSQN